MRQLDRVGNNIKPDSRMRQIDRVGNERPNYYNNKLPIKEEDLPLLKEIENREYKARELMYKGPEQTEEAMKILEENISHGLYCDSYGLLSSIYHQKKEYDKELDIIKKEVSFFEEENIEVPKTLLMRLKNTERKKNLNIFIKNNEKGQKLEKEGDIDGAIKAYLENLKLKANTPFTYERLYILYRKKKDYKSEIDVINFAIEIYTENGFNPSAIDELKNRLEKAQKLYEKDKNKLN